MKILSKLCSFERGQTLVELAIILPLILLLTLGIMQLALIANTVMVVNYAAFSAARVGIVNLNDPQFTRLVNLAARSVISSLSPQDALLKTYVSSRRVGKDLEITVTYQMRFIFPLVGKLLSRLYLPISATSRMRVEY